MPDPAVQTAIVLYGPFRGTDHGDSGMAGQRKARTAPAQSSLPVDDYRHAEAKRPNNPPAAIAAEGRTPPAAKIEYAYESDRAL